MRSRKKRSKNYLKIRLTVIISALIIGITASVIKVEHSVRSVAVLRSKHIADKIANEIIGETVKSYIESNKYTYDDFAAVLYDSNKNAISIEAIPYNINKVQSDLTMLINKKIEKSAYKNEKISLGSLTDTFLLIGKGPKIKLRICPSGAADIKLKSEISEAGINQTYHRISVVITLKMSSSVPIYNFETSSEFEFLLAENLIFGKVPAISPPLNNVK